MYCLLFIYIYHSCLFFYFLSLQLLYPGVVVVHVSPETLKHTGQETNLLRRFDHPIESIANNVCIDTLAGR